MKRFLASLLIALMLICSFGGSVQATGGGVEEVVTYSISYQIDDGTNPADQVTSFASGFYNSVAIKDPTHTTKVFDGWYYDTAYTMAVTKNSDNTYTIDLSKADDSTKTVALFAKWKTTSFSITYNLNDGSWKENESGQTSYTAGDTYTFPEPVRKGYTFGGWFTSEEFTDETLKNNIEATDNTNIVIYAKWVANVYTIKYNLVKDGASLGEGVADTMTVTVGENTTLLTPTDFPDGYAFNGWSWDSDYASGVFKSLENGFPVDRIPDDANTEVNLYANWVIFEKLETDDFEIEITEDGTFISKLKNKTSTKVTIPESVDVGGKTLLIDGIYSLFKDNTSVTTVELPAAIDQLAFDTFTGCTSFNHLITYSKTLSVINLDLPKVFNLTAYKNAQAAVEVKPSDYDELGKIYLIGNQFLQDNRTINFFPLTKKIIYTDGDVTTEEKYELDTNHRLKVPTKENYTFIGWNTKEDLSGEIIKIYNSSDSEELTLYAMWEKEKFLITYYLNGGINPVENSSMFYSADGLVLKTPVREGYAFAGWYTESTFENKIEEISVGTRQAVELYAKWEVNQTVIENEQRKKTHKIIYELNGGTNSVNNPSEFNEDVGVIFDKPIKPGYRFVCWCSDSSLNRKMNSISPGVTMDVKVYARWQAVTIKQQKVTKLQNKKGKKLFVKIRHISGIAGSELQYSLNKKFKVKKTKTVELSNTERTTTIKNLKKGKTYYVRVRSYKYDSVGNKVYGKWSVKKKIKITK